MPSGCGGRLVAAAEAEQRRQWRVLVDAAGIGLQHLDLGSDLGGLRGATGLWFGVAKDAAATKADVIADMAFTGGTWKLVGLTPNL